MNRNEFVNKIRRLAPQQPVTISFAYSQGGHVGLCRLSGMIENNPEVQVVDEHKRQMMAIVTGSNRWGGKENCLYTLTGLSALDDTDLFVIADDIEKIEVNHGAKDLVAGRDVRRKEAAQKIIDDVLTELVLNVVQIWGFTVSGALSAFEGISAVAFQISALIEEGAETNPWVLTVYVDGWSGRIIVDGVYQDLIYSEPGQLQGLIIQKVEDRYEEL